MSDQNETDELPGGPVPPADDDDNAQQETGTTEPPSQEVKSWNRKTCDERTYEAMYQEWKAGTKGALELGQKFGLSDDTTRRYINHGMPRLHRPSFRMKLQMESKAFAVAAEKAADRIAEELVGEHREIRKQTLMITKAGRAVLGHLVGRIVKAIDTIPLTRNATRLVKIKVKDGEGEREELVRENYERPMDLYEVGQTMQKISGGLSQLSRVEFAALGIEDPENPLSGIAEEEKLTQDEIDYILAHGGQLPEGMTVEELIRRGGLNYGMMVGNPASKAKKEVS